jgi:Fe-S-cluster-containing dehydrogenase component
VCTFDPEKTIWSHAPLGAAGKGRSIKSLDLAGCYACTACDAAIDRQSTLPAGMTREQVEIAWHEGHLRSLVLLRQKGLV